MHAHYIYVYTLYVHIYTYTFFAKPFKSVVDMITFYP